VGMTHLRSRSLDVLPGAYLPSVVNLRYGSLVLTDAQPMGYGLLARTGWTSTCGRTNESHLLGSGPLSVRDADDS
jgi:hypothetical protein